MNKQADKWNKRDIKLLTVDDETCKRTKDEM